MRNQSGSRLTMAVLAAALVVVIAGGVATASNMAFKMNRAWAFAGGGQIGDNWTSVPFNNPYVSQGSFCTQVGLISAGAIGQPRATITVVNASTGVPSTQTCGTAGANSSPLPPDGRAIRVRQPNVAGALTNGIIVGSHNPSLVVTIADAGNGTIGDFWFSVPYHTTAVTMNDLCLSSGLTSTGGIGVPRAQMTRINAATGVPTSQTCGTAGAIGQNLVLGEAVRIREPNGPKSFTPAHF